MVEPIFLQLFAIGAHKEIKPLCNQPSFYATLQQTSRVHMPKISPDRVFCAYKLGGGKNINKFNMLPNNVQQATRYQAVFSKVTSKGSFLSQSCLSQDLSSLT